LKNKRATKITRHHSRNNQLKPALPHSFPFIKSKSGGKPLSESKYNFNDTKISGIINFGDVQATEQTGIVNNNYAPEKQSLAEAAKEIQDLSSKILLQAQKVAPEFLYRVPEIEGYSKAEVVNEIYEMEKDAYLEALPLYNASSQYPVDFQNIKITRKGRDFFHTQTSKLVQKQKILILTAIPRGLRLDVEIREIEEAIKIATNRDLFEVCIKTAVRPKDIRRAVGDEKPQVVHFCGHGMEDGSLLLEDDGGNHKPVKPEGLAALFELYKDDVKCVLLNACHSEKSAMAISQYINYTIGMNQAIKNKAAIAFAQGFYDSLGRKKLGNKDAFQKAFNEGIVAVKLENISLASVPTIYQNKNEISS
jgi:CHAT domain